MTEDEEKVIVREFLKSAQRMCASYPSCAECPLSGECAVEVGATMCDSDINKTVDEVFLFTEKPTHTEYKDFAMDEILAEMERQKITGAEMGELIGLSQSAFSCRVTGRTDFKMSEIEKICMILGLEIKLAPGKPSVDITKWNQVLPKEKRRYAKKGI